MRSSSLRVAVCPLTGIAGKPTLAQNRRSSSSTLAPSPSNSSRKLAWVPVVPLMPRTGVVAMRWSRSSRSSSRSCSHRQARLPTVVGWAGWKWVKPRVGWSAQVAAKAARAAIASCRRRRSRVSASWAMSRSPLSVTKQLVAPRCRMGRAFGAWSPQAWMAAITSWRRTDSWRAMASRSTPSWVARSSASCSGLMGRPSSASPSARAIQSRRQTRMR